MKLTKIFLPLNICAIFIFKAGLSDAQETGMTGAQFTEVVDAFDVGDPYDFNLSIAYEHIRKKAQISRECNPSATERVCVSGAYNDFISTEKVLESKEISHIIDITALFGIFHDLQLKVEIPIIVQRSSELNLADGVSQTEADRILNDPASGLPLFEVPFVSTNRSGIDYFVTGLEWGILNQARNPSWPTWNVYVEALWGVGKIMKPSGHAGGTKYGTEADGGDAGISRGNIGLRGGTRIGRRFKYINPYFGFEFLVEFPKREAPYPFNNDKVYDGEVNLKPPIRGFIDFGLEVIPWEVQAKNQKFFIDLRFIGGYVSEGRDYSELYDALGTTKNPSLNYMNGDNTCYNETTGQYEYGDSGCPPGDSFWEREITNGADFTKRWKTWYDARGDGSELWTGLTDIENYGTFGGRFTVGFITSKWFKIMAGIGVTYNQPHFITFADECNSANYTTTADEVNSNCEMGPPKSPFSESSFNPDFRAAIDWPGNRFKLTSTLLLDIFVNAVAMF